MDLTLDIEQTSITIQTRDYAWITNYHSFVVPRVGETITTGITDYRVVEVVHELPSSVKGLTITVYVEREGDE